jgi:hypothetical protein
MMLLQKTGGELQTSVLLESNPPPTRTIEYSAWQKTLIITNIHETIIRSRIFVISRH